MASLRVYGKINDTYSYSVSGITVNLNRRIFVGGLGMTESIVATSVSDLNGNYSLLFSTPEESIEASNNDFFVTVNSEDRVTSYSLPSGFGSIQFSITYYSQGPSLYTDTVFYGDIVVTLKIFSISGYILDDDGSAIENIIIEAFKIDGSDVDESPFTSKVSGSNGYFEMNLISNRFVLIPRSNYYDFSSISPDSYSYLPVSTTYSNQNFSIVLGDCEESSLIINKVGNGYVYPSAGNFCKNAIVTLTPNASAGYFFSGWDYELNTGIVKSGINVIVPMTENRILTAIFKPVSEIVSEETVSMFYCPSYEKKENIVSFDFLNSSSSDVFHFRANFYSDQLKTELLYSAFSLTDNKRWFYRNSDFYQIGNNGVTIGNGETVTIVYDPEIFSNKESDNNSGYVINNSGIYELPLLCGVKYYVDIEGYRVSDSSSSHIESISLLIECNDTDNDLWSDNSDERNWICSGQGKQDLKVSNNFSQSIMSSIESNLFGVYKIVWQQRNMDDSKIYSATWDSENDVLFSSGQGLYDELKISYGNNPIVLKDQSENFYITSNNKNNIYFKTDIIKEGEEISSSSFSKICYPGINDLLNENISARIRKEDVSGSLVVNSSKVIPVISKQDVKIDVNGVSGAYAVRVRESNDLSWSDWINIDNDIYYKDSENINESDKMYSAYSIDNDRFVLPYNLSSGNGIKRICLQILTLYGVTNTFCVEVFVNKDVLSYSIKFYSKKTGSGTSAVFENEFPKYNGKYVLSLKSENGEIIHSTAKIYFKVIFNEPVYKNKNINPPVSYSDSDLSFNMIQQGISDYYGGSLLYVDDRTFYGEIDIFKEDGVFNVDGISFIEILFPSSYQIGTCKDNMSDKYNLMIGDASSLSTENISPEEAYNNYKIKNNFTVLDINNFRNYYNNGDENYKFGNPGYFRE